MNTNWNTPKTNVFAGMLDLRKALAAGMNAKLVRASNEDCGYPIKEKDVDLDFRNYEFSNSMLQTRENIINNTHKSDFEKHLSLNYKIFFGAKEAVERYYKTGLLSQENFKGMGVSHLVKVEDMIIFFETVGDEDRAKLFRYQYLIPEGQKEKYFYDNYKYNQDSPWAVKTFKHKVWVIELFDKNDPKVKTPFLIKILNIILYPAKFIPTKSVLYMTDYKCVGFRIGGVINGLSVEFHIPKKFGFKD